MLCVAGCASGPAQHPRTRNVVIFVADGLRQGSVNPVDAPTLFGARNKGVHFVNSHSLFPTLTTANASAMATGHSLGDTGVFSNTEYIGLPIFNGGPARPGTFGNAPGTPTPFLENNQVLADIDDRFPDGSFIPAQSLLAAARERGLNTAAIGKLGPVAIQDLTQVGTRGGQFLPPQTVVLDDATGSPAGLPLSPETAAWLAAAGLAPVAPERRQSPGTVASPGTLDTNAHQQRWLVDATTKAVLPAFVRSGKPFVLVYWSRDPDGTQHNQGDSLNRLSPGINGPTSRAAVANADANLRQILDFIDADPALRATTDVLITSDHGFATISKHEIDARGHGASGYSTTFIYRGTDGQPEVNPGWLPPGFLAIDLAHALNLPLFDADAPQHPGGATRYVSIDPSRPASQASRQRPTLGSALLGGSEDQSRAPARVVVASNGGSDLIYIPDGDRALARTVVEFLLAQDYTGAVFVDSALGEFPGALPMSSIGLEGVARMPRPAIVVAFRTFLFEPGNLLSAVQIADTTLQEGQGSHGSFGRDNTLNNMTAFGPDFKQGFVDAQPVSNADIAMTAAQLLGLTLRGAGSLRGRVLTEALAGGSAVNRAPGARIVVSAASPRGRATALQFQQLDGRVYFDAACLVDAAAAQGPAPQHDCRDGAN
jgi:hypothetical protein